MRRYFFDAEWHQVYDFIEFVAARGPRDVRDRFMGLCNVHLERESSAYRFVNGKITQITSAEEVAEIDSALGALEPRSGVTTHLRRALELLSDRNNPDYRNSIKESISAVEALAKTLSGDARGTLGAILAALERSKKIHPALKSAFSSLYGYTNDANGIRHALLEEPTLTSSDARFMLICCSAFINYAVEALGAGESSPG